MATVRMPGASRAARSAPAPGRRTATIDCIVSAAGLSGWAGGEDRQWRRCCGACLVRMSDGIEHASAYVHDDVGEVAAIERDGVADFDPESRVDVARHDAEIAADVGDDGTDRAAADLYVEFLLSEEAREARILGPGGRLRF